MVAGGWRPRKTWSKDKSSGGATEGVECERRIATQSLHKL
jgi:hypothetical protein